MADALEDCSVDFNQISNRINELSGLLRDENTRDQVLVAVLLSLRNDAEVRDLLEDISQATAARDIYRLGNVTGQLFVVLLNAAPTPKPTPPRPAPSPPPSSF